MRKVCKLRENRFQMISMHESSIKWQLYAIKKMQNIADMRKSAAKNANGKHSGF